MPTVETIRQLVQGNEGVAFLPRMCVEQEIEQGAVREVRGEGDARGAQNPAGVPHAARAQPRGAGVSGSSGVGLPACPRRAEARLLQASPPALSEAY